MSACFILGSPYYFRNFSLNQLVYELPESLRSRRNEIKSHLAPDEMLLSISQFPLLGAGEYIDGQGPLNGPLLHSKLLSDDTLNAVPPFNLEINGISDRRGEVPLTGVPVFHDTNTPWPYIDPLLSANTSIPERLNGRDSACMIPEAKPQKELPGEPNAEGGASENFGSSAGCHEGEAADNCLYLDSPLFGIGSGGVLRVTLCAADLEEARILYDHLASMSAIMLLLVLTAKLL
ncbi:glutamate--cysteine ligase [Linderina macrospora]|uniref:Glutamate--cysteine ligase n=1 Tax=Linderina macrospora TaxID=4868 RepID=A0ACC1JC63_9FUNG|nr:glutamate--cysteine ligase [Linderina macrospora]